MGSEYLADSQIQGYLVHNIRLRALGWFNIETGLLEDELKTIIHVISHQSFNQGISSPR
jgi:hypothetical protein